MTSIQYNLPPLISAAIIDTLLGADLTTYLHGYGIPNVPRQLVDRRRLLKGYIGCREP